MSELPNGISEDGPSPFARRVLDIIDRIPAGRVMTYGLIATIVDAHPRQVGQVMTHWADETHWHRVVYANGTPATCHGNNALVLLRGEGTPMRDGRVDLVHALWNG
ncbi:MGMT family protein [Rhodococcus qingshengii]|jgi:alkylated DNA nucleotide flippase Atl1|uniref:MGMT family protein n=2 Tax=Actinomycetes TaxID=1760 RepID=A0ABV5XEN9_9NOCA|nr:MULTISPECIES: MGMT family protein [Rhodococcus]EEN86846.1 6-O-methylguanine DNA methyltransferase, DNA binding domain protein [Rhodococcus erythropolis SK121]NHP18313.1 6-O-methylguanine DNA methyltransferase [Rhodococcus sp. IC4_135]OKA06579.1 6-O-methylguanine DNA methyltransferase [Rhodococcus erythropolis]EME17360.1 methylated-DNA-(protein)-cysteine S-methyltransferase DNA binding protein [Rhodococcus qingshengii BKS 20-40]MBP1054760.1 MGMT family protein [Rhodococcus qingshengii]